MVAALLLGLAGVPTATIAEDYALTEQAMQNLRPRLMAQTSAAGGDTTVLERLLSSHPEDMVNFLVYLQARYMSSLDYMRTLGLSAAQIDALVTRLVERADTF